MKIADVKHVAVIGAGTMGHGIAEVALLSGYTVFLYDITDDAVENGKALIDWSLKKFVEKARISESDYKQFMDNLTITCDLKEAVKAADLCIEAVPEKLELKLRIFRDLDTLSPKHAILATNTSNMSITVIGAATQRPGKVIGLHFPPPPPLAKMIEIVKGDLTSDETIEIAVDFTKNSHKVAIISKDSPGFICNRIVAPSMLLTQLMLDRKEYDPAKLDATAMNMGMIMGPYELQDFIGHDIIFQSMQYLASHLSEAYAPTPTLMKMIEEKKLGKKTGEGMYKWPEVGRPKIDRSNPANFDLMDLMRVQINEATKVLEEGIANAKDIDIAMKLHYHNLWGPFELAKNINLVDLATFLDGLADKYGKEVFRAHKWVQNGTLMDHT
ncbi:MAG: 3-hydroxyacyl-CoA dehydrogenase NAD-binding domain-containing protein [Candidatus Hodarchaeales archaeon]